MKKRVYFKGGIVFFSLIIVYLVVLSFPGFSYGKNTQIVGEVIDNFGQPLKDVFISVKDISSGDTILNSEIAPTI